MAKTLVTGGTGLVGYNIIQALLAEGRQVRALVRSIEKSRRILPAACEIARGDVAEPGSLHAAMHDCDVVYHAAGLPEQWLPDPSLFDRVNVGGTRAMVDAALLHGIRRFVYTSTIDVFAAARGAEYDESVIDPLPKGTPYERSKQAADRIVTAALDKGLQAVFLHPSAVYGPGPAASPGINNFIVDLAKGKVPLLLPGGFPVVYAADVARGHVLAELHAAVGERFILSEAYYDLRELARGTAMELGIQQVPRVMPRLLGFLLAQSGELAAAITKRPPLIPKGQLHFMQWQARPSAARAMDQLGWKPLPLSEGLHATVAWLREQGRI